jgi:predicted dehydrogenase
MKKKLLIIGCGNIAIEHTKAFLKVGFDVGVLFASNKKSVKLKKYRKIFQVKDDDLYFNYKIIDAKFLKEKKIDAILLVTSIPVVPKILKIIVDLKIPILVEKPVGIGINWYKDFKNKKITNVIVGFNRRFYRNINYIKSLISNNIDEIDNLYISIPEKIFLEKKKHFEIYKKYYSNTAHVIDLLFYLFGNFKFNSTYYFNKKKKTNFFTIISNKNMNGIIDFSFNSPKNFSLSFELKKKRYVLEPIEVLTIYDKLKIYQPTNIMPLRIYRPVQTKRLFSFDTNYKIKSGFYSQALEIKKYLKNKKFSAHIANLNDAYNAQNFLFKLMKSNKI